MRLVVVGRAAQSLDAGRLLHPCTVVVVGWSIPSVRCDEIVLLTEASGERARLWWDDCLCRLAPGGRVTELHSRSER